MSHRISIRILSAICFASGLATRLGGRLQLSAVWFGWLVIGALPLQAARPEPTNWFSGDMHVHRSCGGAATHITNIYNAMVAQDLSVVSVLADMGNGEVQNPTTDLPKVTGADDAVSTSGRIVHWDAEWHWDATYYSYAHQALGGHLVLLGLTNAQQLWEESTYPILNWAHQQGAIGGFAHFQYLPSNSFPTTLDCCTPIEYPVEVAMGACDFISQDVAGSDSAMLAYYRLLNCGFRPGFAGGSDYPCNASIGAVMTFVKVNGALTYRKWIDGIAAGNTVVSRNGRQEFLDLKVNTNSIPGDTINLPAGGGAVTVNIQWSAISSQSGSIELVHNGTVIATQSASVSSNNPASLATGVTITNSGWVAARRMGSGTHKVHTGAVFVQVNNAPIRASATDALFYVNWMDQLLQRSASNGAWSSYFTDPNRAVVRARYQAARDIYQQIANEAAAQPVSITTAVLPAALVNAAYSTTLSASGGVSPYTWSLISGALPAGFSLNTNSGVISGTSGVPGTNNFTVQVRDASSTPQTNSRALSLTVGTFAASLGLIGNTNTGTSSDSLWGGSAYINAGRFQASSNMIVALLRAQVTNISGSYKCAIYTESNSLPSRLLGFTVPVTNPATGWQTFPLTSPLTLTNGSYYWLAIWSGSSSARTFYSANNGTLRWGQYNYGNWPDPVSAPTGNTFNYSIYATGGSPPAFVATPTNRTVSELTLLTVTNNATDSDVPWQTLTYTLVNPPTNAVISTNGVITWTPSAAQGPSTNDLVTVVNDGVVNVTNSFQVIVMEGNTAPQAGSFGVITPEDTATNLFLLGSDAQSAVTYSLVANPTNGTLSGFNTNTGAITYQPNTNYFGVDAFSYRVSDGSLLATGTVSLTISAVNDPPVAANLPVTLPEDGSTNLTLLGGDVESAVTYSLVANPTNGTLSGFNTNTGAITYQPNTNYFGVDAFSYRVSDGSLLATGMVSLTITAVNDRPVATNFAVTLPEDAVTDLFLQGGDVESAVTYSLVNSPTNGALSNFDTNTGAITYQPNTNYFGADAFSYRVSDGSLYATGTVSFTVTAVDDPPVFAGTPTNRTIPELTLLTVTNSATDVDTLSNALAYALVNAPTNAAIDTNGVITWTPTEAQGPSSNVLTTVVSDGVSSVTNSFEVVVTEVNVVPVFVITPTNLTVAELTLLTVTNSANDSDLPAQLLDYSLVNPPAGAAITNGVITWTPGEEHGGTTNDLITVVGDGLVNVTNSFQVIVTEVNEAPWFNATPPDTTIPTFTLLTVTNMATDADMPVQVLTYDLLGAPPGAVVSEDGVISWTPGLPQAASTNVLTTLVSDGLVTVTNSFLVMVTEVPLAPVILTFEAVEGLATLSWSTISGQRYVLECVDELTDTNWVEVLPEVTATGSVASMTNSVGSAAQRFYRVKFVAE